jgi:hypothetical protein
MGELVAEAFAVRVIVEEGGALNEADEDRTALREGEVLLDAVRVNAEWEAVALAVAVGAAEREAVAVAVALAVAEAEAEAVAVVVAVAVSAALVLALALALELALAVAVAEALALLEAEAVAAAVCVDVAEAIAVAEAVAVCVGVSVAAASVNGGTAMKMNKIVRICMRIMAQNRLKSRYTAPEEHSGASKKRPCFPFARRRRLRFVLACLVVSMQRR